MTPARTLFVIALLAAAGCDSPTPTQPRPVTQPGPPGQPGPPPPPPPSSGGDFEVSGTVTDERGAPMPGVVVTMAHYARVDQLLWPKVSTDASGNYRFAFTAYLLAGSFVARAQVVADGYEEFWRSLSTDGRTTFVLNVRLSRIIRITAGESTVLSVSPDDGDCRSFMAGVCGVVGITTPKAGRLTVEVFSDDAMPAPQLEVCCESGNEVWGNPVTLNVAPAPELQLLIGLGQGVSTPRSFKVKTSYQ